MTQLSDEVVERVALAIWDEADRKYLETEDLDHCRLMARAAIAAYEAKGDIPLDDA